MLSDQVRKLAAKWRVGGAWPKRLEWMELHGIRGWSGQRFDMTMFPLMAIVGENGSGKSTILQGIASVYNGETRSATHYASDFFPDTPWDHLENAEIRFSVREGDHSITGSINKPSDRWRKNPERRNRHVQYVDLRRSQPISTRVGFQRLAKRQHSETRSEPFDAPTLARLSSIIGKNYASSRYSLTDADAKRWVPVLEQGGSQYSGFHQGSGETIIAQLLKTPLKKYSMVLIDEIETSLHPRSQRRLIRDLAEQARLLELQVVVTTHSPYVLEELPEEARVYTMANEGERSMVVGVSPEFALTRMDDSPHPEVDIYVEDDRARDFVREVIAHEYPAAVERCDIVSYGAASVGRALGTMVRGRKFKRPTMVFLDGDQPQCHGCIVLPGDDAPERVVFDSLRARNWPQVADRIGREPSRLIDSAESARTIPDHHLWLPMTANRLSVGSNDLWRAMCVSWTQHCMAEDDANVVMEPLRELLDLRFQTPTGDLFNPLDYS